MTNNVKNATSSFTANVVPEITAKLEELHERGETIIPLNEVETIGEKVLELIPQNVHLPKAKGSRFVRFEYVDLDSIAVPESNTNIVRKKGKNPQLIDRLMVSFQNGVNLSLPPIIVRKESRIINGVHTECMIVCGHNRHNMLRKLNVKGFYVAVYEFAQDGLSFEDSVRRLQLTENDHYPSLESSTEDVVNTVSTMISQGSSLVENNEKSIRKFVEEVCPNKHPSTRSKIVSDVVRKAGAYQEVVTYTAEDTMMWIEQNTDYSIAGNFDYDRNKIGWSVLEGYEDEFIMNAAKRFHESPNSPSSYFLCRTKAPSEKRPLRQRRLDMLEKFDQLGEAILDVAEYYNEHGVFPWQVEGFLPQDHKAKEKDFISVKEIK